MIHFAILAALLAPPQTDELSAVKVLADEFVKENSKSALSIGIVRGDKTDFYFAGELAKGVKPNADTLYEIGSVTKAFTGTLLADSVLRKVVKLDDEAQPLMPEGVELPTRDGMRIRLIHLATHRSGLPVQPPMLVLYSMAAGTGQNAYKAFGVQQLAKSMKGLKLDRPIGSKEAYSNLGVGLLGHALANANKFESYEALLREQILAPLRMESTFVHLPESLESRRATGYTAAGLNSRWDFKTLAACGGLKSSVNDMVKFARASMRKDDSQLSKAFKAAKQPFMFGGRTANTMGLCWVQMQHREIDGDVWWHNGGTGGYCSFLGTIPEKQIAVIVLNNTTKFVDSLTIDMMKKLSPVKAAESDE